MKNDFPEFACPYAARLAEKSPRFALQVYDPPCAGGAAAGSGSAFQEDPFGELRTDGAPPFVHQRFPDRMLVTTAKKCFMNCRHCTRRNILAKEKAAETDAEIREAAEYAKARPEIRDVLLSGGDILTLDDGRVGKFVSAFAALDQIDIVRVCTRAPAANPGRIAPGLVSILAKSGKVWVNTQFNCADEVTDEAKKAAALLVNAGIPVSCQTVLLKGVNDSTEEMLKLLRALSAARIRPYYVFMCDPVAGTERFMVPLETARQIENGCAERIGGLSLPRFVRDIPGSKRKTPI